MSYIVNKSNFTISFQVGMIFHHRVVSMASPQVMLVMSRKSRKVQRPVCKRNCVWSVVIGRQATTIMHLPVRAARVSFDGVLPKMQCIVVNSVMRVRWTCTCVASARNAVWKNVWRWACGRNVLCPRTSVQWRDAKRKPRRKRIKFRRVFVPRMSSKRKYLIWWLVNHPHTQHVR